MPMKHQNNKQDSELLTQDQTDTLAGLSRELHRLNRHRFIRMHNSVWRLLTFNFMRGMAFGLGSVVGATALLSVVVFWLANLDWIPLVGDWLGQLADQIDPNRQAPYGSENYTPDN